MSGVDCPRGNFIWGDFTSVLSTCCFEVISFEVISFVLLSTCCFWGGFVCLLSTRWFHFGREVISLLDVTTTSQASIIIVSIQSIFQMPLTTPLRHKKLKFKLVNNGVRRLNAVGCDFSQVYSYAVMLFNVELDIKELMLCHLRWFVSTMCPRGDFASLLSTW